MTLISHGDLSSAETSLAVANTPDFLERKLRADSAIKDLHMKYGAQRLRKDLPLALKRKPRTLHDAVLPYAILVALSFDSDHSFLESASRLKSKYHDWYEDFYRIIGKKGITNTYVTAKPSLSPVRPIIL